MNDSKNFVIVTFVDENDAPGIVASNWIKDGETCYYPSVRTEELKNKLLKKMVDPEPTWPQYNIRILKSYDTYGEARLHLKKAEETSNLDPDEKVKKRKRKIKNVYLPGDTSSSDESPLLEMIQEQKKKKIRNNHLQYPTPPKSKVNSDRMYQSEKITVNENSAADIVNAVPSTSICPIENAEEIPMEIVDMKCSHNEAINFPPEMIDSETTGRETEEAGGLFAILGSQGNPNEKGLVMSIARASRMAAAAAGGANPQNHHRRLLSVHPSGVPKTPPHARGESVARRDSATTLRDVTIETETSVETMTESTAGTGTASPRWSTATRPGGAETGCTTSKQFAVQQSHLIQIVTDLSYQVTELNRKVDILLGRSSAETLITDVDADLFASLPVKDDASFEHFNNQLKINQNKQAIMSFLAGIGGKNLRSLTTNILRRILLDDVAELYSLTGKQMKNSSKKSFLDTEVFKLIFQISKKIYEDATENKIKEIISDWLNQAKVRITRRAERQKKDIISLD